MKDSVSENFPILPTGEIRLDGEPLSDKQLTAIDLLVAGKSFAFVAKSLDVTRRTIFNWRQDDNFRATLLERREEIRSSAADRLSGMLETSLDIVEKRLTDRFEPTRFRAAATVLRLAGLHKSTADRTMNNRE